MKKNSASIKKLKKPIKQLLPKLKKIVKKKDSSVKPTPNTSLQNLNPMRLFALKGLMPLSDPLTILAQILTESLEQSPSSHQPLKPLFLKEQVQVLQQVAVMAMESFSKRINPFEFSIATSPTHRIMAKKSLASIIPTNCSPLLRKMERLLPLSIPIQPKRFMWVHMEIIKVK